MPACIQKEMLGKIIRTEWSQKVGLINDELLKKEQRRKIYSENDREKIIIVKLSNLSIGFGRGTSGLLNPLKGLTYRF